MIQAIKNFIVGTDLEQLKLLSIIAEKTDNAIIITDANGLIIWVNQGFTRISGYTLEEVKGKKPGHILQGKDTDPKTVERIRNKLKEKVSFREEILNYHKNGTPYWIQIHITPVFNEKQELTHFIAFELDITKEKEEALEKEELLRSIKAKNDELQATEEELKSAFEEVNALNEDLKHKTEILESNLLALQKAQEQIKMLSLVATYTDNAVIITDKYGKVEWVNPGFTRISGYTLEEIKGKKPGEVLQGKDTDPNTVQRIREKLPLKISFQEEILNYTKDGRPYWLNLSITPILNEVGEIDKFIAIEMDITQRKQQEQQLLERTKDIEQSLQYAQHIQKALLPDISALRSIYSAVSILFQPKEAVGGDFYWFEHHKNTSYLVLADCTGHGIPGALLAMYFQQFLNTLAIKYIDEPLNIKISALNRAIEKLQYEHHINESFEMSVLITNNNEITLFTTQSQPILIQKTNGTIEILKSNNYIGNHPLKSDNPIEYSEFSKNEIKRVFLMSDGILDQFGGPENKRFGLPRLKSIIAANQENDLDNIKKELLFALEQWKQNQPQTDDWLWIGIEI
ncbi:MAG: PAS domain S-box protein [Bacteroidia bacterium]|nr:PAS domain S-box protein [Bacteroidia bacterium]